MAGRSFFRFHRVCAPPCAKKIQSVFRGGVYAAKSTLRGESVADPPMAGQGTERSGIYSSKKTAGLFG